MESYSPEQNTLKTPSITAGLIRSLRPKQWTKNLIVYFALFFTMNETWDPSDISNVIDMLGKASITFLLFCVLSSGIYIINYSIQKVIGSILSKSRDLSHRGNYLSI